MEAASYVYSNKGQSNVYFLIHGNSSTDICGMNPKAVSQAGLRSKFGLCFALVVVGLMSAILAGSAVAAPVTTGGQVHACYRVKGKAKGAMRVVPVNKKCRRGERKLAWSVAGPAGPQGAAGAQGLAGSNGTNGSDGAPGGNGSNGGSGTEVVALETKIASLDVKIESLEGILQGISNSDLTGALSTLDGVTNLGLTQAVAGVPALNSLCSQASLLTGGLNSLNGGIGGITILGLPGLSLNLTGLPAALSPYTCPVH
jgi:hypothetical protein